MLALDVARIEAGLLLIDVDFFSSKKAMIAAQKYTPLRDGARPAGQPRQGAVHRPAGASRGARRGPRAAGRRARDGLDRGRERSTSAGLPPAVGATASRVAVPVYRGGRQVGKATTTTWSPVLKKMIALATVDRPSLRRRHAAADRGDGRSRAPQVDRDGGEDAVLQSASGRRPRRRL